MVGGSVVTDQAGAVHHERHVQLLQTHVVDDLVVGALQEGRVDRGHRLAALKRQAGGKQHGLLLGDPDVEVPIGQLALEDVQPGARVHRCGDPDHAFVATTLLNERLPEHLGVLRGRRLRDATLADPARCRCRRRLRGNAVRDRFGLGGVPLLHPLEPALLGRGKALALDGGAVDDHGTASGQRLAQGASDRAYVVSVDHADVGEVELLPPQSRGPEGLERLLDVRPEALERGADADGQLGQPLLELLAGPPELGVQPDPVEIARERAHVGRDRHPVVVEHDDDRSPLAAGLVDRLEGDASGHGAIAHNRHHVPVLAVPAKHRLLDPDGIPDRGRGVARAHDVVLGFVHGAEWRQPAVLADRLQAVAAPGEDLVGIGLVADIPQDLVARRIEHRVQRHGDLARTQVGSEVAADLTDRVDDVLADLLGQELELVVAQRMQVLRFVDPRK